MSSLSVAKLDLMYVGIIIFCGLLGGVIARKIKVPDIVIFLLIGMGLGPAVSGVLNVPADSIMNQMLLTIGACYLLFEGGATLRFAVLREIWITLLLISTLGVVLSGFMMSIAGVALGLPLMVALMLAAITASTDPATLVPIFKQVPIKDRVSQTVMSESALNDAMGAIATFAVLTYVMSGGHDFNLVHAAKDLAWEVSIGLILVGAVGYFAALLMAHDQLGIFREVTPFVIILAVITVYLLADAVHASGFIAVFTCGVVIGNKESFNLPLDHHEHDYLEDYVGNTALLMRMFIFILLGSQVDFHLLKEYLGVGLALLGLFIFVARPVTVFVCAWPDRRAKWSLRELLFMSWTRETGVIPAALVGMLAGLKVPDINVVGAITFIFILGTILIQAPTTSLLASRLGLLKK